MSKYKFDTVTSNKYCNENMDIVKPSKCYDNVWNLFNIMPNDFDILFCYIEHPQLPSIYFKHCVYVNKSNEIIDVTLPLLNSDISLYNELDLIIIKRFSKSEYLEALSDSMVNGYSSTDLEVYLKKEEVNIKNKLLSENKYVLEMS